MNENFTPEFKLQKSIIAKALHGDNVPSPSLSSLEFIRNFSRNFRVRKSENGIILDYALN